MLDLRSLRHMVAPADIAMSSPPVDALDVPHPDQNA